MITVRRVFDALQYPFVQNGLIEIAVLGVGAGVLGTWIVLRGLAFYSHAVGAAAFPGLVLADGLGFSPLLAAFGLAVVFALAVARLGRRRGSAYDTATALALVAALAGGIVLASDVFDAGSNVDTLLFGSLLLVDGRDIGAAAAATVAILGGTAILGRRWLAVGFDPETAGGFGLRSAGPDLALLVLIAGGVVAALSALGALLASALFVVPAATTRLWVTRVPPWQLASAALAVVEGVVGLWLSVQLNVPPGPAVAVLAGGTFAVSALAQALRSWSRAAALTAAALFLAGCGASSSAAPGRVAVVATTTQLGDWVRAVGGTDVDVHQLLQPNTDPHEYEPRPADVVATAGARLVFENGDGLDEWMAKVVSQSASRATVIDLGTHVPVKLRGDRSRFDPHWWHDPVNAAAAVRTIRDALVRVDPRHREAYTRRADRYLARVRALDRRIRTCFRRIPRERRRLVTDHDAFGYFARRYGIEVVGAVIPAQTTQAQPSAGETARLIALIRHAHVRAVFPESSVSRRLARAIARETGATARFTLYGDTLGPRGSAGATYLGMEAANAAAMARGFTGSADACRLP